LNKPLTLLVEDVPTHQKILSNFLQCEGFIVYTAENCSTALRFLTQFKPDVLITNLSLPGMTGLELIQRIKSTKQLNDIPIVAIDNSRTFRPNDVIDAGAAAILRKPLNLALLMKTLMRTCASFKRVEEYAVAQVEA
jgi:CheY-like chemotaxis protein